MIGLGGSGGNALNYMIAHNLRGIDFIVADTDAQVIAHSKTKYRIQLGSDITRGLCSESERLRNLFTDTFMVFVIAGMGGDTGTDVAPVIAEVAHEMGVLTVAVVTKPFGFEGKRRMRQAEAGIAKLRRHVDSLLVIPNQKLIGTVGENCSRQDAFCKTDDVLLQAVRGISELIIHDGYMNVKFANVKAVLSETSGMAMMMGFGVGTGDDRASDAAKHAISSPLLDDVDIHDAPGMMIYVKGSEDMTLAEYDEAVSIIQNMADEDANIICGMRYDPNAEDEMRVTVVVTVP